MPYSEQDINDRIAYTKSKRSGFVAMAKRAERMHALKAFTRSEAEALAEEGQEQVIPPDPYNATHLAERLVSPIPLIEVPANAGNEESTNYKDIRQKWLRGAWTEINTVAGENVIRNATWQLIVMGRAALQVTWIRPRLPERRRKTTFPIQVRNLNPYNIGVERGPYTVEYAYHQYQTTLGYVLDEYPDAKKNGKIKTIVSEAETSAAYRQREVEFTEWWNEDSEGVIWNAKLVEGEFIQKPEKSDYDEIPIIEVYGDTTAATDPNMKTVSMLFPMEKLWKYKCRVMSQMATGLLWYFWPFIYVMNDQGQVIPDADVRPGKTAQWPAGSQLNVVQIQPNMPLAEAMMNHVETGLQNSSFPNVLFGDAGNLQSGYGVNLLSQAAGGRISQIRTNLEASIAHINEMMLGFVEKFADDEEGVTIYGYNTSTAKPFGETLLPKHMENGFHRNIVRLEPNMPEDDIARITMAKTLADSGIISKRTVRDRFLRIPLPDDEENRILLEMALTSDELRGNTMINALAAYTPTDWEDFIAGSPLADLQRKREAEQLGDSDMEEMRSAGPAAPPPFLPPGGPPIPPPVGPPGGAMPPMPPMQPPAQMIGPQGGGIPPQLQGQITPDMLGQRGIDPVLFAEMMGRPMEPADQDLAQMGFPARRY